MIDNENIKNLVIGGVLFVFMVLGAYFYVNRTPYVDETLLTGVVNNPSSATMEGNFIAALNSLKRLKLDDSVFRSAAWTSFADFGRTLAPQPKGRTNPFAPIGASEAAE